MGEPQGVGGFPFVVYQSLLWFCGCDSTGRDSVEGLIVSVNVYLVSAHSSIMWLPLPEEELLAWELVMIRPWLVPPHCTGMKQVSNTLSWGTQPPKLSTFA